MNSSFEDVEDKTPLLVAGVMHAKDGEGNNSEPLSVNSDDDVTQGNKHLSVLCLLLGHDGSRWKRAGICPNENILLTMGHAHCELYNGKHYTACHLFVDVADNGFAYLRLMTSTKPLELDFAIETEAKVYFNLYEGTTYTDQGTLLTSHNNNRNSSNATTAVARHTPTIDVVGSCIRCGLMGSAGKFAEGGGAAETIQSRILKISTDYLLAVQNKGGAAKDIAIRIKFFEDD